MSIQHLILQMTKHATEVLTLKSLTFGIYQLLVSPVLSDTTDMNSSICQNMI
jgi:hypothetical protein